MTVPAGLLEACVSKLDSEFTIVDSEGVIRYTNEAWQAFAVEGSFSGDPSMVGENYFEGCHAVRDDDGYGKRACDGLEAILDGEEPVFRMEYPCGGPDGKSRWFLMWAVPIEFEGQRYAAIEHLDITDRKQVEQELETRNKTLETVGSILAHDISSPMSAAVAWAETIANADSPDPEHAQRLVSAVKRMDAMIDDALFLARGLAVEEVETISLAACAGEAWNGIETQEATLEVEDRKLTADSSLLRTMFENLFRNSIEHGGSDVHVSVGIVDDGFFVEDNGTGIPESERDQMFETGYSTHSTGENTGMGLTIVSGIVTAHDWNLTVAESESGGVRFEITIPPAGE